MNSNSEPLRQGYFSEIEKSDKPAPDQKLFAAPQESAQGTLFGDSQVASVNDRTSIETIAHNYIIVDNGDELKDLVKKIGSLKEVCFDTETTSINPLEADLVSLAFSWEKGTGYLIYFPESREETLTILEIIRPVLESPVILKIGQNLKYDIQVLANYGIEVSGPLFDTMIAHYLLEPDMRHNMNLLSETYLSYNPVHIESLIGEKGNLAEEYAFRSP